MKTHALILLLLIVLAGCKKNQENNRPTLIMENKFDQGYDLWATDFADYPVGGETLYELQSSHKNLPLPLDQNDGAVFISGKNHSDDLYMFLKKKIEGLKPNTNYRAVFHIDLASNAPSNASGIGGAPGEGVSLGIGITSTEPNKIVSNGMYRMNIDKGNQSNGGEDVKIIGNIANGTSQSSYVLLSKSGEFDFTTDNNATVWAIVSTDSGFEGTTALYYTKIRIEFFEIWKPAWSPFHIGLINL